MAAFVIGGAEPSGSAIRVSVDEERVKMMIMTDKWNINGSSEIARRVTDVMNMNYIEAGTV
jgi:hypothetical protein